MSEKKTYIFKSARYVPASLCLIALVLAFAVSPWWLISIPFALIASSCSTPDLATFAALPAYIMICLSVLVIQFHSPSGWAVLAGAAAGFYGSAWEMRFLAKEEDKLKKKSPGK